MSINLLLITFYKGIMNKKTQQTHYEQNIAVLKLQTLPDEFLFHLKRITLPMALFGPLYKS